MAVLQVETVFKVNMGIMVFLEAMVLVVLAEMFRRDIGCRRLVFKAVPERMATVVVAVAAVVARVGRFALTVLVMAAAVVVQAAVVECLVMAVVVAEDPLACLS